MTNFRTFRLNLTLLLVALYMLLDGAFMLVRLPPGTAAGIPTGELLIAFFFFSVAVDLNLLTPFLRSVPIVPLVVWWLVGTTQLIIGLGQHGFWAFRDATSLIEALFLWIGFVVASVPGAIPKIVVWFQRILVLSILIVLTYPFRSYIASISPVITSARMEQIPLFFTYHLTPITSLVAALHFFTSNVRFFGLHSSWFAGLLIIFIAALLQARAIYLQILFLVAFIALTRPGNAFKLFLPLSVAVAVLFVFIAIGVPIPGRLSDEVSLSFFYEHFLAIAGLDETGGPDNERIRGAAGGVNQRLMWWGVIWDRVTETWTSTLFGLGYGVSLVGLARDPAIDDIVREPHNSFISALGRTGFVGLAAYAWLNISLAIVTYRVYVKYKSKGYDKVAQFIYLLGAMFALYWIVAQGEDSFEKPFVAIPYYFFCGIILHLHSRAAPTLRRTPLNDQAPLST